MTSFVSGDSLWLLWCRGIRYGFFGVEGFVMASLVSRDSL